MCGQYGDIILVHGDNLISGIIQNLTNSFFAHAALCAEFGKVAEMTRFGFAYHDNQYLSGTRPLVVLRHFLLFPGNQRAPYHLRLIRDCIENYRKNPPRYDYFEILGQALKLVLSRGDQPSGDGEEYISTKLLLAASERLICSALVDSVYEAAGIDLFPGRKSRHTTPADIASLASGPNPTLIEVYRTPGIEKRTWTAGS